MAWQDRLRQAAYTSPSGKRLVFFYEDVSREIDKKGSAFNFPDADGTYIQDLGKSGYRYPLRMIFWGENYDTQAEAFENLLLERGRGKLEHPIYGRVDVVPLGGIKRRDDLKSKGNQAIIDVTLWETIGVIYPEPQADPASSILDALNKYNLAAADQFAQLSSLSSAVEQASAKSVFTTLLDSAAAGLQAVADTQADVQSAFNAVNDSINRSIDILIGQPLTLASQTLIMLQAPARALTLIRARLDAYKNLAQSITQPDSATKTPGTDSQPVNDFAIEDLYSGGYVAGSVLSAINNIFANQGAAIEAADDIAARFVELTEYKDANLESLSIIDTGEAYQQLQTAVGLTLGFLVEVSFNLKQERTIILQSPRTVIDLSAELYKSVADEDIDFLITSNSLNGDEILELPRGKAVKYYV